MFSSIRIDDTKKIGREKKEESKKKVSNLMTYLAMMKKKKVYHPFLSFQSFSSCNHDDSYFSVRLTI